VHQWTGVVRITDHERQWINSSSFWITFRSCTLEGSWHQWCRQSVLPLNIIRWRLWRAVMGHKLHRSPLSFIPIPTYHLKIISISIPSLLIKMSIHIEYASLNIEAGDWHYCAWKRDWMKLLKDYLFLQHWVKCDFISAEAFVSIPAWNPQYQFSFQRDSRHRCAAL